MSDYPVPPQIAELRAALEVHDAEYGVAARWSPPHDRIIDAARSVLTEWDRGVAAREAAVQQAVTANSVRSMFGAPR